MGNVRVRNREFRHQHQHQREQGEYGDSGSEGNGMEGVSGDEEVLEEKKVLKLGQQTTNEEGEARQKLSRRHAVRRTLVEGLRRSLQKSRPRRVILSCSADRTELRVLNVREFVFQPEGGVPPLHANDVLTSPSAPSDKKAARVAAALARNSLPKRGSGLTDRSRLRGWFTSTST